MTDEQKVALEVQNNIALRIGNLILAEEQALVVNRYMSEQITEFTKQIEALTSPPK